MWILFVLILSVKSVKVFLTRKILHSHSKTCANRKQKLVYPEGGWVSNSHSSLFVELACLGIFVPYNLRFCDFISVFDFEIFYSKEDLPKNTENTEFFAKLVPASTAIASNVPGFEKPIFFTCEHSSLEAFLERVFVCFCSISDKNFALLEIKYKPIFKKLAILLNPLAEKYNQYIIAHKNKCLNELSQECIHAYHEYKRIHRVQNNLTQYIRRHNIFAFNLSFDGLLLKSFFASLAAGDPKGNNFSPIQKGNKIIGIFHPKFCLLDICNYLAPNTNYELFLESYCKDIPVKKGRFPYEWFTSLEKLNQAYLPPIEDFYSTLKGVGLTQKEYAEVQHMWSQIPRDKRNMLGLLESYNFDDVKGLLLGIQLSKEIWAENFQIHPFKEGVVTLPSLAQRFAFKYATPRSCLILFGELRRELRDKLREQLTGGQSLILKRYAKRGETKIREHLYGHEALKVQRIVCYDAINLYGYVMQGYLPTGDFYYYYPVDRLNAYQGENSWKKAFFRVEKHGSQVCTQEIEWLEWVRFFWEKEGMCQNHRIIHRANSAGQI